MSELARRLWKPLLGLLVILVLPVAIPLLLPSRAQADNTVCAGAIRLVPDASAIEGVFTAPSEIRWFKFIGKARRSYAVMNENTSPTDVQPLVSISGPTSSCGGASVGITAITDQEPDAFDGSTGSGRWAVVLASDTQLFFGVTGSVSGAFRIRVVDTTQFSPLWSTFSGFETFYRFQNTTNQALFVVLILVSDAGATVAETSFTIAPTSTSPTRHTGPADLGVADDMAGQAIIKHNGTPGALQVDGFLGAFSTSPPIVLPVKIVAARADR